MYRRTYLLLGVLLVLAIVAGCGSLPAFPGEVPTQVPGVIYTMIAATAQDAAAKTAAAAPTATDTPLPTATATRTPTITPSPTATIYFRLPDTLTPSKTIKAPPGPGGGGGGTTTPLPITEWPDWRTGTVVEMPQGSSERIGTTKMFDVLVNVKVKVIRDNGVKLREYPSLVVGTKMVPKDTILYLNGLMNKNKTWNWFFVKAKAPDGKLYWIGDRETESSDPTIALEFVP